MKRSLFLPVIGLSISVFFAACEKQAAAPESPAPEAKSAAPAESKAAVTLDGKKLLEAFASAGPEE